MDTKKLIQLRKNEIPFGKKEIDDLEKLVGKDPAFGLAQVLLARGYKISNSSKYDSQLKIAALYANDRKWLYDFIHLDVVEEKKKTTKKSTTTSKKPATTAKKTTTAKKEATTKKTPAKKTTSKKDTAVKKPAVKKVEEKPKAKRGRPKKTEAPEVKTTPKKRGRPKKEEVKSENKAEVKATPKKRGRPKKVKTEDSKTTTPRKRGRPPKADKEKEVKAVAKKRGRPKKVKPEAEEKKSKPVKRGRPPKAKKEEAEFPSGDFTIDKSKSWDTGEKKEVEKKAAKKAPAKKPAEKKAAKKKTETKKPAAKKPVKKATKKNAGSSKKIKKAEKKEQKDDASLLDELARENITYRLEDYYEDEGVDNKKDEGSERSFLSWLDSPSDTKKKEPAKDQKKKAPKIRDNKTLQVIDNFLNNKVSKRSKAEFYDPAAMAKASDSTESPIVTETLAEIYSLQGRIKEAISIYQRLILLFPQKEAYFAGLVKKLEEEKDN